MMAHEECYEELCNFTTRALISQHKGVISHFDISTAENIMTQIMLYLDMEKHGMEKCQRFIKMDGMQILYGVFRPPFAPRDARLLGWQDLLSFKGLWINVLKMMKILIEDICVCVDVDVIQFLFTLLHHQDMFSISISILEVALYNMKTDFSLASIPDIDILIMSFSAEQLALFLRVSCIFMSAEEKMINSLSVRLRGIELIEMRRHLHANASSIVQENIALMVHTGAFRRVIDLLRIIHFSPNVTDSVNIYYAHMARISMEVGLSYSKRSIWEHIDMLFTALCQKPSRPIRYTTTSLDQLESKEMQMQWLQGIYRSMVNGGQRSLNTLRPILSGLKRMLDGETTVHTLLTVQRFERWNQEVETQEEAVLELQFMASYLRMYSTEILFCIQLFLSSTWKYVARDYILANDIPTLIGLYDCFDWNKPDEDATLDQNSISEVNARRTNYLRLISHMIPEDTMDERNAILLDLINKLLFSLPSLSSSSTYRDWFFHILEKFYKYSTLDPSEAHLHYLFNYVVAMSRSDILNSDAFDLLAVLCRKKHHLLQFESVLGDYLEPFIQIAMSNLSNANVFFRCIVRHSFDEFSLDLPCSSRFILFYEENKLRILQGMVREVEMSLIDTENICIIGTAVIVCTTVYLKSGLRDLILCLREDVVDAKRFLELLWLWQQYYCYRGRDRITIEFSGKMPFGLYENMIDLLMNIFQY